MAKKKNVDKLTAALQDVEALIHFLHSRLGTLETKEFVSFQREGLGSLRLDYEEAGRYRRCLRDLTDVVVKEDDLSQRRIEMLLQEAILKALDLVNQRQETALDDRIEEAKKELRRKLLASPVTYHCYIPALGLSTEGLPASFGNVRFIVFDESTVDIFRDAVSQHQFQREFKEKNLERYIERHEMMGKVFARVDVTAKDVDAAPAVGVHKLRRVLDSLNYFSAVVPYHPDAWTYLGGEATSYPFHGLFLNLDDGASFSMPVRRVGPLQPLSMKRLLESDEKYNLGLSYIDSLLTKPKANGYEKSLLTAIQWAGRAAFAVRREEAFLLNAIALESVLLTESEKEGVTDKLRTRIAHLIGGSLETRKEVHRTVRDLYRTRSKIVHNGSYQVTDLEREAIQGIALTCINRLCTDEAFRNLSTPQDLVAWFDKLILSPPSEK